MKQCQAQLSSYTIPKQSLEIDALDLATLANTSVDMIDENTSVHIVNQMMNIDEVWKVVEYDADLNEVYKPKVTLSNKAVTLTGTLNSLIGSMVRNDDSYNGVQIGNSFGLRIKKGNNVILLNAKEGISIKNGDEKVFYIDTDGNLRMADGIITWGQISNTPVVLSADDIKNTVITKDYIASLKLLVGNEIEMGTNAVISWANITDDAKNKLQVKFQYSTDDLSWHDSYVNTDVYMRTSNDGGATWNTGAKIKGADGANGTNGTNGIDSYIPDWVTFTEISKNFVKSGLLQGNQIFTSIQKDNWLELEGGNIYFMHKNTDGTVVEVFRFSIDSAADGKPQLFFANGCSIDTYNGSLRLRTSDNNYLRVNSTGGLDYIYHGSGGDKTIQIVGADGTLSGGGSGGYLVFA